MKAGYLSEYFTGVAAKRLSAVEASRFVSRQHEFNGVESLKRMFGLATGKQRYKARFVYLNDHDEEAVIDEGLLTWYDARESHETRSEHRLYFPTTTVSECADEGDLLVIGKRPDGSVLVVVAQGGSTIANQILWLFGLSNLTHPGFSIREELGTEQDRIEFAARTILEQIGVETVEPEETRLDEMLRRFDGVFPTTREFSEYTRSTLDDVSSMDDPDAAIIAWMEREEILFRTLEKHVVADRLTKGFSGDVDGFFSFSLSVQNRRKSRVGYALENHLEAVFTEHGVRFVRSAITEGRSKPDFLFPGSVEYHDEKFQSSLLSMLGVKSSCKDRWRQVLAEADRIQEKHLLTLETSISENQTDEMQAKRLKLVVPKKLHETFSSKQQSWLMDLKVFLCEIIEKQVSHGE